jgi:hypothetical protein
MATVYKAFQPSLQREVALKVLRPGYAQDQEFRERFEREAIAIAKLRHPHIVQVFDFEVAPSGEYVLAMEFLEGGTLKERLTKLASEGRGIDPAESVRILGEVAAALAYAHEKGVVHRDVKPSNVMLTQKDWAVVTDFGIARILGATSHTQTGVGIGTPEYMAPEQGQGSSIDHRADIYSLGAMAYEMLTGRVPYSADTPLAVVLAHIKDPLPLPSKVNPSIGKGVERALLKALAKVPSQRFDSATAFADALKAGLAEDTKGGTMPTVVVRAGAAAAPSLRTAAPAAKKVTLSIPPFVTSPIGGIAAALVIVVVVAAALASGALRSTPAAIPSASPAGPGGAASGAYLAVRGPLIYEAKLQQLITTPGPGAETTANGSVQDVKVSNGEAQLTAPAGTQQAELVFNAGQLTDHVTEMSVLVTQGSSMRFAFCPRSGTASPQSPASSYCFTFLIRAGDPNYTIELRYQGGPGATEVVGAAANLPVTPTLKIGAVTAGDTFILWVNDQEVMRRSDTRLAKAAVPPLVQVSRLGTNPSDSGTVKISAVRIYQVATQAGAVTPLASPAAPSAIPTNAPRAVPSRGALIYEAKLDGVTQVIQDPRLYSGAAGSATVRYVPGAMELTVSSSPTLFGGQLRNAPRRQNFVLEFDVSASPGADVLLSFDWGTGGASGEQRTYHLLVDVADEIAHLGYADQGDASKSKTVIDPVPLPGIRSGQTVTIALVVDGVRRTLYVNERPVQPAEHDPQFATVNPLGIAIGTGEQVRRGGSVRIHSLRMYEVR